MKGWWVWRMVGIRTERSTLGMPRGRGERWGWREVSWLGVGDTLLQRRPIDPVGTSWGEWGRAGDVLEGQG